MWVPLDEPVERHNKRHHLLTKARNTMAASQPKTVSLNSALTRANLMIEAGKKLTRAADMVADPDTRHNTELKNAAETIKEHQLLNYRVTTNPDELIPVLNALLEALSSAGLHPKD